MNLNFEFFSFRGKLAGVKIDIVCNLVLLSNIKSDIV